MSGANWFFQLVTPFIKGQTSILLWEVREEMEELPTKDNSRRIPIEAEILNQIPAYSRFPELFLYSQNLSEVIFSQVIRDYIHQPSLSHVRFLSFGHMDN